MLKQFVCIIAIVLLVGCGSKQVVEEPGALSSQNLKIFTYGEPRKHLDKRMRNTHAQSLSSKLHSNKLFSSVEYAGDGEDIAGVETTLRITFLYVVQGQDKWPLEVKAHYILENNGKVVFNQVYKVVAKNINTPTACLACDPEQSALLLLEQEFLPDLIDKLKRI